MTKLQELTLRLRYYNENGPLKNLYSELEKHWVYKYWSYVDYNEEDNVLFLNPLKLKANLEIVNAMLSNKFFKAERKENGVYKFKIKD